MVLHVWVTVHKLQPADLWDYNQSSWRLRANDKHLVFCVCLSVERYTRASQCYCVTNM